MKERPLPQACATQESRSNQVRQTVRRWIGPTSILCSRRMSSAVKCTGPESVQIRIGGAWVLCTQERNKITFLSVFCVPVSRGFEARLRVSGSRRGYGEAPQSRFHEPCVTAVGSSRDLTNILASFHTLYVYRRRADDRARALSSCSYWIRFTPVIRP
jgi:hypothetical protein